MPNRRHANAIPHSVPPELQVMYTYSWDDVLNACCRYCEVILEDVTVINPIWQTQVGYSIFNKPALQAIFIMTGTYGPIFKVCVHTHKVTYSYCFKNIKIMDDWTWRKFCFHVKNASSPFSRIKGDIYILNSPTISMFPKPNMTNKPSHSCRDVTKQNVTLTNYANGDYLWMSMCFKYSTFVFGVERYKHVTFWVSCKPPPHHLTP